VEVGGADTVRIMAEKKAETAPAVHKEIDGIYYGIGAVVVMALITLPEAAVAWGIHYLYPTMRRSERIVIAVATLLAMLLSFRSIVEAPIVWFFHMVGVGHGGSWPNPILGMIVITAFYVVVLDTLFATKIGGSFRMKISDKVGRPKNPFGHNSLIPNDQTRSRMKVAAPPGGGGNIGQHHLQHSTVGAGAVAPGQRRIAFAVDHQGRPVELSEYELGMHGAILGSTGSGKTVTIKSLSASLLDLGWDGMILDLKEDLAPGGLRDFCRDYATYHTIPFQQMGLSETTPTFWFNPLAGMDPDYARDTILSLTDFDDAYWQNINKKMLGQLVNLCYDAYEIDPLMFAYPTINGIGHILESGNLKGATTKMRAVVQSAGVIPESRYIALKEPDQAAQTSSAGFGAKLTQMYDTQAGRGVLAAGNNRVQIDVTAGGLTYIGLDSTGKPDLAKLISSAVLQRMSVYAAQRTTGQLAKGKPRFLIIDEASVVDRSLLQALLSKARSSGIAVVVCTQGPDDWIDKQGDDWSMLIQNINVGIIMSQGSPRAAELCADFIGQVHQFSLNQRVGEDVDSVAGSVTQRVDYVVHPHEVRQLKVGEAILRVGKPDERVSWIGIQERDPRAT
jgi:hypothetical protein